MIFASITFIYFFIPILILIYFAVPSKLKNAVILLFSLFFYAWGEKLLVLLFIFSIVAGWILGLLIEKKKNSVWSKIFLFVAVVLDLGILVYFKYTGFFIESFNNLFNCSLPLLKIALPIGISFYTFQLLSYEIDVFKGSVKAQKNIIDFATYVSMFPQLIAGPIVRYSDVEVQLKNRTYSLEKIDSGITRFIIGFGKKVLIANTLGELTSAFRISTDLSVLFYWLYAVAFMLQIYYDFSGYSDMAIGLGRIFGFEFTENFNYPYISKSITEFWRRWHISLGSWFRDYVYIPLGGNKKGIGRQLINITVVWMLTGFWHGAAWNFVLWGLFYAVLLMMEKLFLKKILDKLPVLGHIYTLFFVLLGFVLFNGSSLSEVLNDFKGLFGIGSLKLVSAESVYYLKSYGIPIILGITGSAPLLKKLYFILVSFMENRFKLGLKFLNVFETVFLIFILGIGTAYLVDGSFNPFLYFRF